ncbi:MAG: hypothetical protein ACLF0P_06365 [Thermoanaerobaculia bacterium]
MHRIARVPVVTTVFAAAALAATLSLAACGGTSEEDEQVERQARLAELEQQKAELDALREELARKQDRLGQAQAGDPPEGEEAEAGEELDAEELEAEIEQTDSQITTMAEELNSALVEFINADPPIEGEPLTEVQKQAFDLKAQEDMALAEEYIGEGGDYRRAIRIYEDVLAFDPNNEQARQALDQAQAMRYMDPERFAQVQEGMTKAEVADAIGPANLRNRKDYPEEGVQAWYYPKSEAGDAAAVWFREEDGEWVVYNTEFDAVESRGQQQAGA